MRSTAPAGEADGEERDYPCSWCICNAYFSQPYVLNQWAHWEWTYKRIENGYQMIFNSDGLNQADTGYTSGDRGPGVPVGGCYEDGHGGFDYLRVVGYNPNRNLHPEREFLMMDLYVDRTLARVVVAASPSYQFKGTENVHWEIQPPTAWSETSITVELNRGTFVPGQTCYLFVFDSANRISNPYPVTWE